MPAMTCSHRTIIVRVFPRYGSYFSVNYWENKVGGAAVLWIIELAIVVYMYYKKFKVEGSYYASVFTLAYLSCELMGLQVTMFSRVGLFFRPFLMLLFPTIEKYFGRKSRLIIRIVLMALLAMLFFSYASTPVRQYVFWSQ